MQSYASAVKNWNGLTKKRRARTGSIERFFTQAGSTVPVFPSLMNWYSALASFTDE